MGFDRAKCEHKQATVYARTRATESDYEIQIMHLVCERCGLLFAREDWASKKVLK